MIGLRGNPLEPRDYQRLEARWIDKESADRALLRRVDSQEGGQLVGRNGASNYSGLAIPYVWPGEDRVREFRLRRDYPEVENGKERGKYLTPPGKANMLYLAIGTDPAWLHDVTLPIVLTEGEFKCIALFRAANYDLGDAAEKPRFLPLAISGVWNFRGTIGKATAADGARVDETGVIPDLARLSWTGRRIVVAFDRDLKTNKSVQAARHKLARELKKRGAIVKFFQWPKEAPECKGVDDILAAQGPDFVLKLLEQAPAGEDWRTELLTTDKGKRLAVLQNCLIALRHAPEWQGVLAFNESSFDIIARVAPPWDQRSAPFSWSDEDDGRTAAWLQKQGIMAGKEVAGQAVQIVAHENCFHPIRDYLDSLKWDGVSRIDDLLARYLGAVPSEYLRAVGARWLIGAVARIYRPGVKNDSCLILEGPQGKLKSTAVRVLAGDCFFSDDISDLGSKDSVMQSRGVWIIELSELDSLSRPELSRVKSFMSRQVDRIRPPYGRRVIEAKRECVFIGTTNKDTYLKDETGGRRFWPVKVGFIDIDLLHRDRDQLWAEARERYQAGEKWWLDSEKLNNAAAEETHARYEADAWEEPIRQWIESQESVSVSEVLEICLGIPKGMWKQSDQNRVARCLVGLKWKRYQDREGPKRLWRYRPKAND